MIADKLKVLEVKGINEWDWDAVHDMREKAVRIILDMEKEIKATFAEEEYLKMDLTNGEILGLKSHAKLGDMEIGDLPAMNYVLAHDEKYKGASLLNLGNVNELYKKLEEEV